jgi:hypothetical protein
MGVDQRHTVAECREDHTRRSTPGSQPLRRLEVCRVVSDQDIGISLDSSLDRSDGRIERQYDSPDGSVRVSRKKSAAVPILGPLEGEANRNGTFYV